MDVTDRSEARYWFPGIDQAARNSLHQSRILTSAPYGAAGHGTPQIHSSFRAQIRRWRRVYHKPTSLIGARTRHISSLDLHYAPTHYLPTTTYRPLPYTLGCATRLRDRYADFPHCTGDFRRGSAYLSTSRYCHVLVVAGRASSYTGLTTFVWFLIVRPLSTARYLRHPVTSAGNRACIRAYVASAGGAPPVTATVDCLLEADSRTPTDSKPGACPPGWAGLDDPGSRVRAATDDLMLCRPRGRTSLHENLSSAAKAVEQHGELPHLSV